MKIIASSPASTFPSFSTCILYLALSTFRNVTGETRENPDSVIIFLSISPIFSPFFTSSPTFLNNFITFPFNHTVPSPTCTKILCL